MQNFHLNWKITQQILWRSFDETLSTFYERESKPQDTSQFDEILLVWDRLLHILSCGEHCIILRSEKNADMFTRIIFQLVRVIRGWLNCRMSRKMIHVQTPLASSMLELFCPWLLSACERPVNVDDIFCFDKGRSVAFSACCMIMGIPNDENINARRVAEIYSCIGRGLMEGPAVVESILLHSNNIFSSGQQGVTALIPSYLYAIDKIMADQKKYERLGENVRECIPILLSSIFSYSVLFRSLPSQPLMGVLNSQTKDVAFPLFTSRVAHAVILLQRAFGFEKMHQ